VAPPGCTGRHDEREPECHLAVDTGKQTRELDLHDCRLARRHIADGDGENILPFLFTERRPVALVEGLLVRLPGGLALQERALDHPAVDLHPNGGYRGSGRDREDIDGLQGFVEGVDESLTDGGLDDHSLEVRVNLEGLEGQAAFGRLERAEPSVLVRRARQIPIWEQVRGGHQLPRGLGREQAPRRGSCEQGYGSNSDGLDILLGQ